MQPIKHWILDHAAYTQICELRRMLLARLADFPDDIKALGLADVIAELDPEHDPALREHARRAHAVRGRLGAAAWIACAVEHGLDVVLFNLCADMHRAGIGHVLQPVLARRAAELSADPRVLALLREQMRELPDREAAAAVDRAIAARAPRLAAGVIERAFVPPALLASRSVTVRFHPTGHLAAVRIAGTRRQSGSLVLAKRPGSGHLVFQARTAGHGYVVDEHYRDGAIHAMFCSPWHDGVESTEHMDWARWVAEALASLERIAPADAQRARPARPRRTVARASP